MNNVSDLPVLFLPLFSRFFLCSLFLSAVKLHIFPHHYIQCVILWGLKHLKAANFFNIWFGWCEPQSHRVTENRGTFPEKDKQQERITYFYQEQETNAVFSISLSLHFLGILYIVPNYTFRHFVTSESTSQCWRFTKSVAGFILPRADVKSCEEDGVVVVSALSASQGRLPVAEAVQCVVCMVVDHQAILWDKADKGREKER